MSDIDISTHDLTKRSTMEQYQKSFIMEHFNSRPHEEVDQLKEPFPQEDQLFQLTTSRRGRLEGLRNSFNSWFISTHDLTKRSTRRCRSKIWFDIISTHDLTKRSTQVMLSQSLRSAISTHDLTKRSTRGERKAHPNPSHFNSRPHEEVDDNTGCGFPLMVLYFNSRPHEEVDNHRNGCRQN